MVMTEPPVALLELARHGSFTPVPGTTLYFGRYAFQDLHSGEAVRALLDLGLAEQQDAMDADGAVFPTRAGLEEALRYSAPTLHADDSVSAVLGSREWERPLGSRPHLAGLFLSPNSSNALLEGVAAIINATPRPESTHLETTGGIVPAALAEGVSGSELKGAPGFELAQVPATEARLLDMVRRYRFIMDIRAREGTALLLQWAGPTPRIFGPLTLGALAAATKMANPNVERTAPWGVLAAALADFREEPDLGSME
jgi:hypothetical protein